ncbi:type I-E CRISPR-associated protein Cse2/CasB [Nocardiopsis algeriensis]|uniref:type I-E CRISPR-associated protein Cse2/CasB n=1 Tax=Nocardiopsis algeriensis TaxID=1478215 RepID=UPI003B435403
MTDSPIRREADRMAVRLTAQVAEQPAVRAVLRKAVGRRVEDPALLPVHALVVPHLDDLRESTGEDLSAAVERAFYAVAGLIAAQPRQARDQDLAALEELRRDRTEGNAPVSSGDGPADAAPAKGTGRRANLGTSLGLAAAGHVLNPSTTEDRLHLLCRQSLDGMHHHLPRLVVHARGEKVHIDWGQLVLDLARWEGERGLVAKEWLQGYHRTIHQEQRKAEAERRTATAEGTDGNTHHDDAKDGSA